jgi:hypothetical protein
MALALVGTLGSVPQSPDIEHLSVNGHLILIPHGHRTIRSLYDLSKILNDAPKLCSFWNLRL